MTTPLTTFLPSRASHWLGLLATVVAIVTSLPAEANAQPRKARLSADLEQRISAGDSNETTVIVTGTAEQIDAVAARHGLRVRKRLRSGAVLDVPAGKLAAVAGDGDVDLLTGNHIVESQMAITNVAIGADQAWAGTWAEGAVGVTGAGVGVAIIDSGVAALAELKSRIAARLDFTDPRGKGLDEWGHGTHVAGIVAAGSKQSDVRGVAPGAHIVSLKVLGADGSGYTADVIDAIDWTIANKARYALRVINLSLGSVPQSSWRDDPLCMAVERAHNAGLVVVAAAGNRGRTDDGAPVFGTINSPGHCPHALTVGALNTKGTAFRSDDVMATYSSKGPTRDGLIKPDLVAPGNRIRGLLAPGAVLATTHPERVIGSGKDALLELSGTSMATAVVSGAAALLIESEGNAGPLQTRLALSYNAQRLVAVGVLTQGVGSLNVLGAVSWTQQAAFPFGSTIAGEHIAAGHLVVGNTILWGDARDTILWGDAQDTILWGDARDTILWGDARDTILWGDARDTILWGDARDTILWGDASDTILWGD